ncbi:MAG: hypothetical protein H0T77_04510 [Pyrinomonadaceae bacterium]|jgi:hypothetical protein|nr:hypothetical protein [Pyrinomonadaceae bacterium]
MENPSSTFSQDELPTRGFRLLGLFPLAFFLAQAVHYWSINELGHMLWMCNIGNLVLAIGLFLNNPLLIRMAVIWMVPGLIVWLLYVVQAWGVFLSSTLAHVGGLIVGIFAIRRVGMDRDGWRYALGWYLLVQFMSRVWTPANLNVNVAHHVDAGWRQTFNTYWKFWLVLTLLTAIVLWIIGTVLHRIWPN